MPFAAGEIVTAARLNRLQPVTAEAIATADVTLTGTEADVTGASITFTTQTNNAVYVAIGTFDFHTTVGSAALLGQGRLNVDGVTDGEEGHADASTVNRTTIAQVWRGTLPAAGSHTIKLRALKNGGGGTIATRLTHTKLNIAIYEVV